MAARWYVNSDLLTHVRLAHYCPSPVGSYLLQALHLDACDRRVLVPDCSC